jgi:histidinol phosphatase-like enzyme
MFSGCNRYSKNIPLNPMPDTVNNLIKKLDISPNNSFFIRDTSVDIETVKNASIK